MPLCLTLLADKINPAIEILFKLNIGTIQILIDKVTVPGRRFSLPIK